MTRPDDPIHRRRALAARVVTLATSVEIAVAGCIELDAPIPRAIYDDDVPGMFRRWAAEIERTRP